MTELWERYREARRRLNATLDLMDRLIELREMLDWELDMDHMREDVRKLRRAIEQHGKALIERSR